MGQLWLMLSSMGNQVRHRAQDRFKIEIVTHFQWESARATLLKNSSFHNIMLCLQNNFKMLQDLFKNDTFEHWRHKPTALENPCI